MSRAGAAPPERPHRPLLPPVAAGGFTLVEILVVLVLLGVLAAVAAPRFAALRQPSLAEVGRDVAVELRAHRVQAMRTGRAVVADASALRVPAGFALLPDDRVDSSGAATAATIVFLPDGRSSGGRLVLADAGGGRALVAVDWLTGEVRVLPP